MTGSTVFHVNMISCVALVCMPTCLFTSASWPSSVLNSPSFSTTFVCSSIWIHLFLGRVCNTCHASVIVYDFIRGSSWRTVSPTTHTDACFTPSSPSWKRHTFTGWKSGWTSFARWKKSSRGSSNVLISELDPQTLTSSDHLPCSHDVNDSSVYTCCWISSVPPFSSKVQDIWCFFGVSRIYHVLHNFHTMWFIDGHQCWLICILSRHSVCDSNHQRHILPPGSSPS